MLPTPALIALQFLTRLPVRLPGMPEPEQIGRSLLWYPLVGVLLGGLLLALVVAIVKLVVGVLIIALFENSMARLRFCATSRVTWAGFGFAFLAFVSLLVA